MIKTGNGESVFVIRLVKPTGASEVKQAVLYRLDVEAGSFEEETTVPRVGSMYYAQQGLSPSGRSWLRLPSTNTGPPPGSRLTHSYGHGRPAPPYTS